MIQLFLQFEYEKTKKYFKTKKLAKIITSILFLSVFLFVGIVIYGFFSLGFRYINFNFDVDLRLPLVLFIYEIFLLILAGVIIFSSLIAGIFPLFKSENDNWIISSPSYKIIPRVVLIRSLVTSSWPVFVMFLPMVLAFNHVYNLGILTLFLIVFSAFLLLSLLNAGTLLFILLVSFCYYKLSKKIAQIKFTFSGLIISLLIIMATGLFALWKVVRELDLVRLFKVENTDTVVSISEIGKHFRFLPTHFFAKEIIYLQSGDIVSAAQNFGLLLFLAVALSLLWWKISGHFYEMWQKFREGSSRLVSGRSQVATLFLSYTFKGSSTTALFKKEALISSRNPKSGLWFLFLFLIWLGQIGAHVILSKNIHKYSLDVSQTIVTVQTLQFIIAIYFICAFTLRFVFPTFSVEKKTAWILAAAPLSFRKVFFGKYLFYVSFFTGIGLLMSFVNIELLKIPLTNGLYSTVLFIVSVLFIVTLGIILGLLFPSKESDDPEVISTSMSGLFFTAFALLYGALSDYTLYLLLTKGTSLPLSLFVVSSLMITLLALYKLPSLAKKNLF